MEVGATLYLGLGVVLLVCGTGMSRGELNVSTSGNTSAEILEATTSEPLTMDDFVIMTTTDFILFRRTIGLKYGGIFEKYTFFLDANNTRYLFVPFTMKQKVKELEEQLSNESNSVICVDGICQGREQAADVLETIVAQGEYLLLPKLVPLFALTVSVFIVVVSVGVTANVLIITGILRSRHLRNSTSVFICSLAVSDVLVLAFAPPAQIMLKFFSIYNVWSLEFCRALHYIQHFSIVMSSFTMAVMSVERYIAICHPLRAKSYCTVRNARNCVLLVWLFSLAICIPVVFAVKPKGPDNTTQCLLSLTALYRVLYHVALMVFVFGLPLFVMAPMYWQIFFVLWKSSKTSEAMQNGQQSTVQSGPENESIRMRKQAIVMLLTVLIAFIICWGPAIIFGVVFSTVRKTYKQTWIFGTDLTVALNLVGLCNSLFNPLICIGMSRKFRDYAKSVLYCCWKEDRKATAWSKNSKSSRSGKSVATISEMASSQEK